MSCGRAWRYKVTYLYMLETAVLTPPIETRELIEYPATLNGVKIDGRWTQVISCATEIPSAHDRRVGVKYLDDGAIDRLYFDGHELVQVYHDSVEQHVSRRG